MYCTSLFLFKEGKNRNRLSSVSHVFAQQNKNNVKGSTYEEVSPPTCPKNDTAGPSNYRPPVKQLKSCLKQPKANKVSYDSKPNEKKDNTVKNDMLKNKNNQQCEANIKNKKLNNVVKDIPARKCAYNKVNPKNNDGNKNVVDDELMNEFNIDLSVHTEQQQSTDYAYDQRNKNVHNNYPSLRQRLPGSTPTIS